MPKTKTPRRGDPNTPVAPFQGPNSKINKRARVVYGDRGSKIMKEQFGQVSPWDRQTTDSNNR